MISSPYTWAFKRRQGNKVGKQLRAASSKLESPSGFITKPIAQHLWQTVEYSELR